MSQQAQIDLLRRQPRDRRPWTTREAVNAEIKDLFAAGADIVQIDEPYMQARPEEARQYGLNALNTALEGVTGKTAVHICFGYAAIIHAPGPNGYSFLSETGRLPLPPDLHRDGAVEPRHQRARPRCRARRSSSASSTFRTEHRDAGDSWPNASAAR